MLYYKVRVYPYIILEEFRVLCSVFHVPCSVTNFASNIYSPQSSQIQALEEGSARTCVGVIPLGPPTLEWDEMTPPPPPLLECSIQG